jgi:hypothetical protein
VRHHIEKDLAKALLPKQSNLHECLIRVGRVGGSHEIEYDLGQFFALVLLDKVTCFLNDRMRLPLRAPN